MIAPICVHCRQPGHLAMNCEEWKSTRGGRRCSPLNFCVRKHEYAVVGRTKRGDCRACAKMAARRNNRMNNISGKRYNGYAASIIKRYNPAQIDAMVEAVRLTGALRSAVPLTGRKSGLNQIQALCHFYPDIQARFREHMTARTVVDGKIIITHKNYRSFSIPPKREVVWLVPPRQPRVARIRLPKIVLAPSFNPTLTPDHELLVAIRNAVPRWLTRDMRDDVVGEMLLAVIEGRVSRDAIGAAVRQFVNHSYRLDHNRWGALSLDEPIPGTTIRRIDTITEGLWS